MSFFKYKPMFPAVTVREKSTGSAQNLQLGLLDADRSRERQAGNEPLRLRCRQVCSRTRGPRERWTRTGGMWKAA